MSALVQIADVFEQALIDDPANAEMIPLMGVRDAREAQITALTGNRVLEVADASEKQILKGDYSGSLDQFSAAAGLDTEYTDAMKKGLQEQLFADHDQVIKEMELLSYVETDHLYRTDAHAYADSTFVGNFQSVASSFGSGLKKMITPVLNMLSAAAKDHHSRIQGTIRTQTRSMLKSKMLNDSVALCSSPIPMNYKYPDVNGGDFLNALTSKASQLQTIRMSNIKRIVSAIQTAYSISDDAASANMLMGSPPSGKKPPLPELSAGEALTQARKIDAVHTQGLNGVLSAEDLFSEILSTQVVDTMENPQ